MGKSGEMIKDIKWVGECPECSTIDSPKGKLELCGSPHRTVDYLDCEECKGTGTITRDATLEEVVEFIKEALYHKTVHANNITINGGTLRVKESI